MKLLPSMLINHYIAPRLLCQGADTPVKCIYPFTASSSSLVEVQVYSVQVSPFFGVQAPGPSPQLNGDLGINFSCSPANTHHLIDAAVSEVQRLQVCPTVFQRSRVSQAHGVSLAGHDVERCHASFCIILVFTNGCCHTWFKFYFGRNKT